jgi:protein involved in polysaccharide export with SLBB domain
VNGKGKVRFYERKVDDANRYHEQAIELAGGSYPAAEHDLNLVRRAKSGAVPFPE